MTVFFHKNGTETLSRMHSGVEAIKRPGGKIKTFSTPSLSSKPIPEARVLMINIPNGFSFFNQPSATTGKTFLKEKKYMNFWLQSFTLLHLNCDTLQNPLIPCLKRHFITCMCHHFIHYYTTLFDQFRNSLDFVLILPFFLLNAVIIIETEQPLPPKRGGKRGKEWIALLMVQHIINVLCNGLKLHQFQSTRCR